MVTQSVTLVSPSLQKERRSRRGYSSSSHEDSSSSSSLSDDSSLSYRKGSGQSTPGVSRQLIRTASGKYDIILAATATALLNTSPVVHDEDHDGSKQKERILTATGTGTTTGTRKKKQSLVVQENAEKKKSGPTTQKSTKTKTTSDKGSVSSAQSSTLEDSETNKPKKKVKKTILVKKRVKKKKDTSDTASTTANTATTGKKKEQKETTHTHPAPTDNMAPTNTTQASPFEQTETNTRSSHNNNYSRAMPKSILKTIGDGDTDTHESRNDSLASNQKEVSFGTNICSQLRYMETAAELVEEGLFAAIWYEYEEIKAFKYNAEDEATAVEHDIVAEAWRRRPDIQDKSIGDDEGEDPHEALRGLEGHTAEGHWRAYKARTDVVNAVLDEQDEQRRTGGWQRRSSHQHRRHNNLSELPAIAAATTCPYGIAAASRHLSRSFANEAAKRGLQDAIVAKRLAGC